MEKFKLESLVIAAGIFLAGFCVFKGLESLAERGRIVYVRGLAEKEVKADHVIWPIVYKTTGNDLGQLYNEIKVKNKCIQDFLVKNGIPAKHLSMAAPEIQDRKADRYNYDYKGDRYNVKAVITVATEQVDKVIELIPRMGELLKEGIAITTGEYENQVTYEFTSLNDIKPEMIEEATRNARQAAEKFAKDSDSKLGKIQSATQGLFSISNRDNYTQHIKNVRVVTSVNFSLED